MKASGVTLWAASGLVALGLAAGLALWTTGAARSGEVWAAAFVRGYAAAWICFVAAAVLVTHARALPRWTLLWIILVAIGLRLVALERTPSLSTDAYRYRWDGRLAQAGLNPYTFAPNAPELRPLRDECWRRVNFKEVPTIYPPLAQLIFTGLARVPARELQAFRWAFALFDLGSVLLLMALLRRTGRPPHHVIWYAWCPLPVTEVTAGAHIDAIGLFLMLLAFALVPRRMNHPGLGSALALAGAVMTKGYAVLALPLFTRRGGGRFAAAFLGACVLLLLPYASAGSRMLDGLRAYLAGWRINAGLFIALDRILSRVTPEHFDLTRAVTTAAVVAVAAGLTWRLRPGLEPLLAGAFAVCGAQLLFGAPALPWYAIWIVPALCWWRLPALILVTLTISMQYYARWLYPNDTAAHYALLWTGYLPVYALLIGQGGWWWRQHSAAIAAAVTPSTE